LLVPIKTDSVKHKQFHEIFAKAAKTDAVRAAYAVDYCEPQTVNYTGLDSFFKFHTEYWKKLASAVKIN
jgi:hypothetical protein